MRKIKGSWPWLVWLKRLGDLCISRKIQPEFYSFLINSESFRKPTSLTKLTRASRPRRLTLTFMHGSFRASDVKGARQPEVWLDS